MFGLVPPSPLCCPCRYCRPDELIAKAGKFFDGLEVLLAQVKMDVRSWGKPRGKE